MVSEIEDYTRQAALDEGPGDGTLGTINWKQAARDWFDTDGTPAPRKVLGYIRRMHALSVPFYGALCAYHRAIQQGEVDPSFTTCEQLPRSDAVMRFSDGSLSQGGGERDDVARRVRVDGLGMDDNQQFGLEMAFAAGVEDVDRAMDLATRSMDAPSILATALERDEERREKVLRLIEADEFGQARALATCGQMSIQLGCPTHGGGCGCEENYVPVSCDCRLCPDCMNRRIGQLVQKYSEAAASWCNPVFGTFTIQNVTAETPEELERAVDSVTGAFGRLRRRTIPAEGSVKRETDDGERVTKTWEWTNEYLTGWCQELVRRGRRDLADRLQEEYVDAEYQRGHATVQGKNIPFSELIDAGFYAVDIKQKGPDEFNVHLHTMWDGAYIPQPALSKAWEDITGDPVVDVRSVYNRDGDSIEEAVKEVVAYAAKPPEFESVEDEVAYVQALKGKRMVQTFGDLHGEVPDVPASLICSECESMPAWWDYLGTVAERIDNMGSIHDGESTGNDPPEVTS